MKVFDCFLFWNELTLLEFRLEHLWNEVDWFVIVEAGQSFRGKPKTFLLEEKWNQFRKYHSKMMYVKVPKLPEGTKPAHNWYREFYQRECILKGLQQIGARDNDLIVLSDVDEIVNRKVLANLKQLRIQQLYRLEMDMYVYHYQLKRKTPWTNATVFPYHWIQRQRNCSKTFGLQLSTIRLSEGPVLKGCGWHFSFFGSFEDIQAKVASYSHQERDNEFNNVETIQQRLKDRKDPSIDTEEALEWFTGLLPDKGWSIMEQWVATYAKI